MNTGTLRSPYKRVWAQFYKAALFELDANKVSDRIAEAETVLVTRARELFHAAGDNIEEEQAGRSRDVCLARPSERVEVQAKREKHFPRPSRLKSTGGQADDGCELHFGTSRQHETRNTRSENHHRALLEQEPVHRAGEIRFRLTKGTFVGDQTGSVGHDETLCLNLG
jgi:hypothetical protein